MSECRSQCKGEKNISWHNYTYRRKHGLIHQACLWDYDWDKEKGETALKFINDLNVKGVSDTKLLDFGPNKITLEITTCLPGLFIGLTGITYAYLKHTLKRRSLQEIELKIIETKDCKLCLSRSLSDFRKFGSPHTGNSFRVPYLFCACCQEKDGKNKYMFELNKNYYPEYADGSRWFGCQSCQHTTVIDRKRQENALAVRTSLTKTYI